MSERDETLLRQDEALLARLRAVAAEVDPPPPSVAELARAAFSLRDLDAELAVLVLDTAERGQELAGVRGSPDDDVRLLSYEAPAVGIELQVGTRGRTRTLVGQVLGPRPEQVVVQAGDTEHVVELDEAGGFGWDALPAGSFRVRLVLVGGVTVSTPWITS